LESISTELAQNQTLAHIKQFKDTLSSILVTLFSSSSPSSKVSKPNLPFGKNYAD
jgi:hypothetical protein